MLEREWKRLNKSPGIKLYAPNEAAGPTVYNEWKIVSVISCGATMTRTMKAANGSGEEGRDTRFFHFSQLMTKTMFDKWRKENYEVCPHCGKEHVKGKLPRISPYDSWECLEADKSAEYRVKWFPQAYGRCIDCGEVFRKGNIRTKRCRKCAKSYGADRRAAAAARRRKEGRQRK